MPQIIVRYASDPSRSRYRIGDALLGDVADLLPVVLVDGHGRLKMRPLDQRDEWRRARMTLASAIQVVVLLDGEPRGLADAVARVCDKIRLAHTFQTGTAKS